MKIFKKIIKKLATKPLFDLNLCHHNNAKERD